MPLEKYRPKHIMHILGTFGPGGAEMGVVRLVHKLSSAKYRHSVCSLGTDITMKALLDKNIPCHSLNIEGPSYTAFSKLYKLFRNENVQIAHVNNLAPWADVFLGSVLAGCKCIQTFHGVEKGQIQFSMMKKKIFHFLGSHSTAITAVSSAAADLLHNLSEIPKDKILLINNGIDTETFKPESNEDRRSQIRQSAGLPLDALLYVCVAALRPVKNHIGLLKAFAKAASPIKAPEKHLVLVGSGPEEPELIDATQQLDMKHQVHFLGRRNDIPRLIGAMDVFVLNSKTEGLSYAVLEAMACGLPIVATEVGANAELVQHGQQGLLYPSGNQDQLSECIEIMASDENGRKNMGEKAREKVVSDYGIEPMVTAYEKLYDQILYSGK